jgi:uncharacterized protein (TIGR03067 family)
MTCCIVSLLTLGVALGADPQDLQGAWHAVSAQRNGKDAPEIIGHRLTFTGDRFTITAKDGTRLYEGRVRLPAADAIDFQHEGKRAGVTWLGLYRVQADRLEICDNAPNLTLARPTTLLSREGYVSVVFKRDR